MATRMDDNSAVRVKDGYQDNRGPSISAAHRSFYAEQESVDVASNRSARKKLLGYIGIAAISAVIVVVFGFLAF